jgi:hypothetical protein
MLNDRMAYVDRKFPGSGLLSLAIFAAALGFLVKMSSGHCLLMSTPNGEYFEDLVTGHATFIATDDGEYFEDLVTAYAKVLDTVRVGSLSSIDDDPWLVVEESGQPSSSDALVLSAAHQSGTLLEDQSDVVQCWSASFNAGKIAISLCLYRWRRLCIRRLASNTWGRNGYVLRSIPQLTTLVTPTPPLVALDPFTVNLYSDLLLHDLQDHTNWSPEAYQHLFNVGSVHLPIAVFAWRRLVLRRTAGRLWSSHGHTLRDVKAISS